MHYEEATVKATYCIQVMIIELRLLAVNKQRAETANQRHRMEALFGKRGGRKHKYEHDKYERLK